MAQNSQIRSKGIGKDAKRHDLDGTPGLSAGSSLQSGEVGQLEAGQKAIQNTQAGQAAGGGAPAGAAPSGPTQVPDPVSFAISKIGGGQPALPTQQISQADTSEFMPMLKRLASGNSSSVLKQAYMQMVANIQQRPWSGAATAVIDRQALDRNVEKAF